MYMITVIYQIFFLKRYLFLIFKIYLHALKLIENEQRKL